MQDANATTAVHLTGAELLLLRRLLCPEAGMQTIDSTLDVKLFEAQRRLGGSPTDADRIAVAMKMAKDSPGKVVGLAE